MDAFYLLGAFSTTLLLSGIHQLPKLIALLSFSGSFANIKNE
jgi:hypothetical protein